MQPMNKATPQLTQARLDQIRDRLTDADFLANKGLGNEIGFYVFDYPAQHELMVREHLAFMNDKLEKRGARFAHLNLYDVLLEMLDERRLLEKTFAMQKQRGDDALKKALQGPLDQEKIAEAIIKRITPVEQQQFVLLSGLGSCWPILRGHSLLNALHAQMGHTPLVLFYPGEYDGQKLHPFGVLDSANYYRAFPLVPHKLKLA